MELLQGKTVRKRYIVYVTREEDGTVERVPVPMRYVYVFLAAAITGMFTIAGMAGSYSRMLAKAESINHMRDQLALTRQDYAHLEKTEREKDVQAASLGSLASEVSAIYGLTAGRFTHSHAHDASTAKSAADGAAQAPLSDDSAGFSDESYYKSLDTYYALQDTASQGLQSPSTNARLGVRATLSDFASLDDTPESDGNNVPDMWPILGPINSGFGEREDPVLGNGEGEFHKGIDIGSPDGTPVHAPHLSGFNVVAGQSVVKGEVIGFVGHSGRVTGPHLHYEVQVQGTAVNPHSYLRTTMAQLGGANTGGR